MTLSRRLKAGGGGGGRKSPDTIFLFSSIYGKKAAQVPLGGIMLVLLTTARGVPQGGLYYNGGTCDHDWKSYQDG